MWRGRFPVLSALGAVAVASFAACSLTNDLDEYVGGVSDSGSSDSAVPSDSTTGETATDSTAPDTGIAAESASETADETTSDVPMVETLVDTAAGDTPTTDTADTGTADTGTADTGTADTGTADTGTPDTGTPDTGTVDTGAADTGTADTGTADTGTTDTGAADTSDATDSTSDVSDGASDADAGGCHPVINEVLTGSSGSGNDEFVEIFNPCTTTISIAGWKLVYRSSSGLTSDTTMANLTGTLAPGAYILAANSSGVFAKTPYVPDYTYASGMAQAGGGVGLRDAASALIDGMTWGDAASTHPFMETKAKTPPAYSAAPGTSMARKPNGVDTNDNSIDFVGQASTPKAAN